MMPLLCSQRTGPWSSIACVVPLSRTRDLKKIWRKTPSDFSVPESMQGGRDGAADGAERAGQPLASP